MVLFQFKMPLVMVPEDAVFDDAEETARRDTASSKSGKDERRQRSKASANVMKTPVGHVSVC